MLASGSKWVFLTTGMQVPPQRAAGWAICNPAVMAPLWVTHTNPGSNSQGSSYGPVPMATPCRLHLRFSAVRAATTSSPLRAL